MAGAAEVSVTTMLPSAPDRDRRRSDRRVGGSAASARGPRAGARARRLVRWLGVLAAALYPANVRFTREASWVKRTLAGIYLRTRQGWFGPESAARGLNTWGCRVRAGVRCGRLDFGAWGSLGVGWCSDRRVDGLGLPGLRAWLGGRRNWPPHFTQQMCALPGEASWVKRTFGRYTCQTDRGWGWVGAGSGTEGPGVG